MGFNPTKETHTGGFVKAPEIGKGGAPARILKQLEVIARQAKAEVANSRPLKPAPEINPGTLERLKKGPQKYFLAWIAPDIIPMKTGRINTISITAFAKKFMANTNRKIVLIRRESDGKVLYQVDHE
jgi:hypothetical protein